MDLTPDVIDKVLKAIPTQEWVWGELRPPAEYSLTALRQPDIVAQIERLILVLRVEPHHRTAHDHRYHIKGQEYVATYGLSHREIKMYRGDSLKLLVQILEDLRAELSMELYEIDPRIGFVPTREALPLCPLFDPPRRPTPHVPGELQGVNCPYCAKPFDSRKPPMWAGGNMGWAHIPCWTEGMQQLFRPSTTLPRHGGHDDYMDALRYAMFQVPKEML
jgi:hypothetical protein